VPDRVELLERLQSQELHMLRSQSKRLELLRRRLESLAAKRVLTNPLAAVEEKRLLLDRIRRDLCHVAETRLSGPGRRLAALSASLDALSPLKALGRGFAVVTDSGGRVLRDAAQAPLGSRVVNRLAKGKLYCRVEESVTEEENHEPDQKGEKDI